MPTVEELESSSSGESHLEKLPKQGNEGADLLLKGTFYPFGCPIDVRTNEEDVLTQYGELWGSFEKQQDSEPVRVEVEVVDGLSSECPPAPSFRMMLPYLFAVVDSDNYSVANLADSHVRIVVSRATLRYRRYAQYFLLGSPGACVAAQHVTAIHAACVALDDRGILLCGESGAGKSTLSYACARAGWTYVSDDGIFLHNGGTDRRVTGDCYRFRLRPAAAALFPELEGLEITPRATGKPSVELKTESLKHIARAQTTAVNAMVFLNRHHQGPPDLVPYSKDLALAYMRRMLHGVPDQVAVQLHTMERLLSADVYELRYSSLDGAIKRLRRLVQDGA